MQNEEKPNEPTAGEEVDDILENERAVVNKNDKPVNMSPGALKLRSWLNKSLRIEMSDKRVLIGVFLCTDRDANVILGGCSEYLPATETFGAEEPRILGLIMVPGKHIVSISIDQTDGQVAMPGDDVIV